jgi:hypothetical protein
VEATTEDKGDSGAYSPSAKFSPGGQLHFGLERGRALERNSTVEGPIRDTVAAREHRAVAYETDKT